jgi:hypothetical protein
LSKDIGEIRSRYDDIIVVPDGQAKTEQNARCNTHKQRAGNGAGVGSFGEAGTTFAKNHSIYKSSLNFFKKLENKIRNFLLHFYLFFYYRLLR